MTHPRGRRYTPWGVPPPGGLPHFSTLGAHTDNQGLVYMTSERGGRYAPAGRTARFARRSRSARRLRRLRSAARRSSPPSAARRRAAARPFFPRLLRSRFSHLFPRFRTAAAASSVAFPIENVKNPIFGQFRNLNFAPTVSQSAERFGLRCWPCRAVPPPTRSSKSELVEIPEKINRGDQGAKLGNFEI